MNLSARQTHEFLQGAKFVKAARAGARSVDEAFTWLSGVRPVLNLEQQVILLLEAQYGGYPLAEVCRLLLTPSAGYSLDELVRALVSAPDGPLLGPQEVARVLAAPEGGRLAPLVIANSLHAKSGGQLDAHVVALVLSETLGLGLSALKTVTTLHQLETDERNLLSHEFYINLLRQVFTLTDADAEALWAEVCLSAQEARPPLSVAYQRQDMDTLWRF